ncbi:MAG: hypothetical protein M1834_000905 [Cirrosporium novae-zelandiae]|nr:MAG: hypothetical protein M1834_000905 [Cirrosporium novae-zelandiae]
MPDPDPASPDSYKRESAATVEEEEGEITPSALEYTAPKEGVWGGDSSVDAGTRPQEIKEAAQQVLKKHVSDIKFKMMTTLIIDKINKTDETNLSEWANIKMEIWMLDTLIDMANRRQDFHVDMRERCTWME